MNKTLAFEVTLQDIAEGLPNTCFYCPIALALKRELNLGPRDIMVLSDKIYIKDKTYAHTKRTRTFINNFDSRESVKGGKFTIKPCKV